jgi:archaellum biogenesis ATPase FlaH
MQERSIQIHDAVTFINETLETKQPIIDGGILPQNSIAIVGGISKQGKSIFVLNMAIQIAQGKPFLAQFNVPQPRRVIYLQAEISAQSMQSRLRKMLSAIDYGLNNQRLFIVNQKGLKLDRPRDVAKVDETIKRYGANVLILDPLYKFHGGDENRVNDMTRLFDGLDRLITQHNISIVLVHHFGKPVEGREGSTAFRGSSAITDYADSYLMLRRKSGDESRNYMKLSFELRNEEEPPTLIIYRNPETLWYEIMGVEGDGKVSIHDVVEALGELGGMINRQDSLIEALKEKTGASKNTIIEAIKEAERLKKILSAPGKGKGSPKTFYLPGMQDKIEGMKELGLTLF